MKPIYNISDVVRIARTDNGSNTQSAGAIVGIQFIKTNDRVYFLYYLVPLKPITYNTSRSKESFESYAGAQVEEVEIKELLGTKFNSTTGKYKPIERPSI